jgi:hypothetical protein
MKAIPGRNKTFVLIHGVQIGDWWVISHEPTHIIGDLDETLGLTDGGPSD